ncbi:MAG: glycosyltransferase family 4 protein [Kiritimatiellia bacterium]
MGETKRMIRERLRWGPAWRTLFEAVLTAGGLLVPRGICVAQVRRRIASVYGCAESEVYLYKSGRAALRGLMAGLRAADPDRRVAFVPDDVCNVVGDACRAAGFDVAEYPTDGKRLPDWQALDGRVRREAAPVVVLCSLFGSVPILAPGAEALEKANPRTFIVADECQNLVPDSPVKPRANRAVVFSFNDKTCPGAMGGGVACAGNSGTTPVFVRSPVARRVLCSVALAYRWLSGMLRMAGHAIRLAAGRAYGYGVPDSPEYSTCLRPHYDLVAEPIYKLSAARAWVSLRSLEFYRQIRIENARTFQDVLGVDPSVAQAGPPYLPVAPRMAIAARRFPAPVKAAYGRTALHVAAPNHGIALEINVPHVRYEIRECTVAQLTSRHAVTDNRILHCMARTAAAAGYPSVVMGPAAAEGAYGRIRLRPCPLEKEGRRIASAVVPLRLLWGALKSPYPLFHFHDPDLLPVGLVLKLFGRRVVYDVHDDYQAALADRLRRHPALARGWSRLWWVFERNSARVFDGVVTADQHLAQKFAGCHPVILRNYPRLDFTAPAKTEGESTFNLIYVGGVTRERGVGMALRMLRLLPMPELRLHVVGTGSEGDLLDELKAEPRVVLHGRVPWTDLHRLYEKAHVGIAIYQPLAGFVTVDHSVKIVEYMAAGIPVVCSNFPGLKKFVEDAGCGLAVQPDEPAAIAGQIRRLMGDADLRRRLGATGRRLFESEYNWEKHEGQLVELYGRIFEA